MRRRTLAIGIVAIVALLAGTAYVGSGLFLRAQFGRRVYSVPPQILDQLCGMPLVDGEPLVDSNYSNDVVRMKRGPAFGPGCLIRETYTVCYAGCSTGVTETCEPEACDGKRNHKMQSMGEADRVEVGPCDFPYYTEARDCALIPDDTAIKYGEYCPQSGQMQKNIVACCLDGNYVDDNTTQTATRTCAPGLACTFSYSPDFFNQTLCLCPENEKWNKDKEVCEPIVSVTAKCGNGVVETGEQCDDGAKNVPSATANKSWLDITAADATTLSQSSCLDTCKLAQCSDKKDNDKKNGIDGNDAACRDGAFGNGSKTLIGYNVEQCPMCQLDEEKDETIAFSAPVNTLAATITVRQHDLDPSDVENLDQAYCRSGKKTIQGTDCSCTGTNEVCFAEHLTDDEGIIDGLGSCDCKKLNPPPDMQTWTWACKTDKDCSQNYRCAYYSTYKFLIGSGGKDVDIYRCKKLIDDGDTVCRSRWDCKSRYKSTTKVNASGKLERDPTSRTKCIEINQGTAKCCNPDAKNPSESCVRPNLKGSATGPIPDFAQCQTGGGAGNIAGGDGGWDSGDGSGGGDSGSRSDGGDGGASSSSSSATCNNYNPCIALTNSPVPGRFAYTMPAACPLTGNKRTCYTRCIADINATGASRDCNTQCSASESDLNMCACNPEFGDCTISCGEGLSECSMLCGYDTNPTACRTECRGEYRSCLNSCGRMCPASANSSSSRRSVSSSSVSSGNSSQGSSKSGASSSLRSSSSSTHNSNTSNSSNYSNNSSDGSKGSQSSRSINSSASNVSSRGSKGSSSSRNVSQSSQAFSSSSVRSSVSSGNSSASYQSSISTSRRSSASSSNPCISSSSSSLNGSAGSVCSLPRMRVTFTRAESNNASFGVEPRVYVDGSKPIYSNGNPETIPSGEWFPVSRVKDDVQTLYTGPNIFTPDGSSLYFQVNAQGSPSDDSYVLYYGTIEFDGLHVADASCRINDYMWYCPERERDGVWEISDNDEVFVDNNIVHFYLHARNVPNDQGRSDIFVIRFKEDSQPFTTCASSSITSVDPCVQGSSSRSSHSSSLSQSKSSNTSSISSVLRSSVSSSRLSSFSSSSSSTSSSSSSYSSSSRSSSSRSSNSSNGGIGGTDSGIGGSTGTTGIGGTNSGIGGTTGNTGIGGNNGNIGFGGTIGGTVTYTSSVGSCTSDQQCPSGTRCILGRCLTVTDIAQLPSFCGNARLDAGEQCDNGADNSNRPNAYCRPDCTLGRCGDAIIDTPLEQCDDGNTFNGDGCSSACQPERGAPSNTLPATTIELPFTNKGDLNGNPEDIGGDSTIDGSNNGRPTNLPSVPSTPDTGPAALAVMIAGGAAGWLYRRRK